MRESRSLDVLIDLANERVEQAALQLATFTTQQREAHAQLDTLDSYRKDYTLRLQNDTEKGVTAASYRNFRRFITTLDQAIAQQTALIVQIDHRLEASREHWRAEKRRLNSYEILKTRQAVRLRVREQRREQRATDEFSNGLHRQRHALDPMP